MVEVSDEARGRGHKEDCRVVVIDEDAVRRRATCDLLASEGYAVVPVAELRELAKTLEVAAPTVIVQDVSLPRRGADVAAAEAFVRQVVGRRYPIVLYGDRPTDGVSSLDGASRALVHIPSDDGGRALLSLLRRLVTSSGERPISSSNLLERVPPPSSSRNAVAAKVEPRSGPPNPAAIENVRLLLIDDSEMTLEIMQAKLAAIGYDVRTALSLGEVRALIANWAPNVIVADIRRPDIPGHELCARLKATVHREDVLIVLCSSLRDEEIAPLAEAARADGWVSKAHGLDDFAARIQAVSEALLQRMSAEHARQLGGAS